MRKDGGLDDDDIEDLLARNLIDNTDAAILRKMDGPAQNLYLEALVDKAQEERLREHPWL